MASSSSGIIQVGVHPNSRFPTKVWEDIKRTQKMVRVEALPLDMPVSNRAIRFVCISDTHSLTARMKHAIPQGDVLLHAGDFTRYGEFKEVDEFNSFLGSLTHKHKIVVAGNHELTFDPVTAGRLPSYGGRFVRPPGKSLSKIVETKSHLTNCIYLEDAETVISGIKIYGSPWQPEFMGWAFNLPRGYPLLEKWKNIPDDTDVLVTHGPPLGHGDYTVKGTHAGCVELLNTVQQRIKPKYHVFGHIHEGYGITSDGQTVFINASTCSVNYRPCNPPIIFDVPLPEGFTKD